VAASCGPEPTPGVTSRVVLNAGSGVKQVACVGDWLVVQRYDRSVDIGSNWTSRLFAVPVEGGSLRELPIPYSGNCTPDGRFTFESPVRAEGDLMLYIERCASILPDGTPSLGHRGTSRLYDLDTRQPVPVFGGHEIRSGLTQPIADWESDGVALDLQQNRAWVTVPAFAKRGVLELLSLTPGSSLGEPSLPFVQLWGLAASPDKSTIVFAARTEDLGPIGTQKATLYIAPYDDPTAYRPLLKLESGGLLGSGWSYDGNWIAFLATIGGARGLYVMNVHTNEIKLIEKGDFHPTASSWSPTDLRIAVIDKADSENRTVRIFDLREALKAD
jgi:WD40 repeat protein